MEMILKKNIFSIVNRYNVKDTRGNILLRIDKKLLSIHNTHTLMDVTENGICKIKRKVLSLLPVYRIFFDNGKVISVRKKTGSINKKFVVADEDGEYTIEGNVLENTFIIKRGEEVLAKVDRGIINMFKAYDIKIDEVKNTPVVISIIAALDIIKYKKLAYLL